MMSSLLRSTKFVRYFTGAARTLILNSTKSAEFNSLVNSKALCASNNILRDYSTSKKTENLEPLLLKLDNEVRRFGKISKKDIDEVFDELRSRNDITSTQSLTVIRCCGELIPEELPEQRTLLVQKIWSVLTERGVPMDISHYNALLKVYIENEHPFSPAKFLEELEMKGLEANRVTYQRLMWRYCQEGDVEGATKVLEKMRELKMPVSEPVLNALVMGHAFQGDTEGAKTVLDTMAGAGLQPSNRTYTLLACGYAKKGDIEGVESIIKTSNSKDTYLSDKDLLDIVEHLAISGHGDKLDPLFKHLTKGPGYNQEARNLILRLISKGHVDIAKRVMKTMNPITNEELNTLYRGSFFIKQLLKLKMSPENVIKTCKELQEENLVPHSFYLATEEAFVQGQTELAQVLISELRKNGVELRQHYYWPLLAQKGKENDEEGLLYILRNMHKEGVDPNGETLKDYVIPYLLQKDTPHNVILKLQVANVYVPNGVRNVMICLLESGNIKKAAELALQYQPRGYYAAISRPLNNALAQTKDIESFVTILHVISINPRLQYEVDAKDDTDRMEVGRIVEKAVKTLSKPDLIEKLLSSLYSKGINIDTESAKAIEQYLGEKLTSDLSELLTKLSSADLEPVPITGVRRPNVVQQSIPHLEHLYQTAKAEGLNNVKRYQKQLLDAYLMDNNVEKVQTFLEELKATDFELSVASLGHLFEFYCLNDNIEKAYEHKNKLSEKDPNYVLNNHKIILMAHALVRANRYDEAIKFLIDNNSQETVDRAYESNSKCWQMLNTLAEQKEPEKVKEMTKVLIENNYVEPTNVLLGPIVKAHLLKEDLNGALKAFEECCKQYRCTPWNRELMKSLILKEDATSLQLLTDLGSQIHGETNNLYELVLAFVECGRLQQARRILTTPGLQARYKRLEGACQRYVQEGKSECLEGLLEVTKELPHIDRSNIFYNLLVSYCKANETDKALGLWTVIQEEDEVPSDEFLKYLGAHLIKNNREVPFSIPEAKIKSTEARIKDTEDKMKNTQAKVSSQNISKNDMTSTIDELIKQEKLREAMDFVVQVMKDGRIPNYGVLKYLLRRLAEEGEVESIQQLEKYFLSENVKRLVSYNNNLTLATFRKGLGLQHMDKLLETVKTCNTEQDLEKALIQFPSGLTLSFVMDNDEILQKCLQIVDIAADKDIYGPANTLWVEYLLAEREREADLIWNEHLCNAKSIMYRRLLQECYLNKKTGLMEKVIEQLKTNNNLSPGVFGNIYSRIIDTHLTDNKVNEAKNVYQKAIDSGITVEHLNKNSLKNLKEALKKLGEKIEYAKIN